MKELKTTETRHLDCNLTDEELKQYGEDLAHRFMDVQALQVERARINAKIKPIEQEIETIVVKIDTKKEVREVECDWFYDWHKGKKWLVRTDTYETVPHTTLDITEEEKQQRLELNGQED